MGSVLLEARPYRPFKSSEEYLYAMKEDLAEWLNTMYPELDVNVDNFMDKLETGVVLCKHANNVRKQALEYLARKQLRKMSTSAVLTQSVISRTAIPVTEMGDISFKPSAKAGTFFARDNVSNFIDFARRGLEILECLLFETEDLIMRKNEKNVILCLLEVARKGARYGMLAPILIQMEREIDREIAAERGDTNDEDSEDDEPLMMGPIPQIVTNDLKSLDEMVRDLVEKCSCPTQFPMIRVSEGKYRIGDTKVLIFVRILRSHVMVRVGGGWDTLSHYLDKHDPCRCRNAHRSALSSKLILKNSATIELNTAYVHYERSPPRTRRSSASSSSSGQETRDLLTASPVPQRNRSRSPTPRRDASKSLQPPKYVSSLHFDNRSTSPSKSARGRSQSPNFAASSLSPLLKKSTRGRSRSPDPLGSQRPHYVSPTLASRNRSRSPSVRPLIVPEMDAQRAKVRVEANEPEDKQQNDSSSEVSDEGYRSLGVIVTTPVLGESQVVSPDYAGKTGPAKDLTQQFDEDADDKSTLKDSSESCPTSREASFDSTATARSSPSRSRRSSLTRSHSANSSENLASAYVSPKKISSPFQRGSLGRSSLGAAKSGYDPLTGRKLKNVSPLLTDLLTVQNAQDDRAILLKMKELINQYSCMLDPRPDDHWMDADEKTPQPRKDSKYDGAISKIPAPVYFKQPGSEKDY